MQDIIDMAKSMFGTDTVIYNLLKLQLRFREPGEVEEDTPEVGQDGILLVGAKGPGSLIILFAWNDE